ncbi:transposase [Streptococcus pneumoniae]|uniref:transposase n=1 Tax=Streptococcus pneumoniae TaxID=1313 RepID=UPI0005DB4569|nr:transposase%2C IS1167%2C internal deletion [Streptococcus pneumoniae]
MLYVGIDVAKNKHDVTALNVPGKTVLKPLTFSNNKAGFELLQLPYSNAKLEATNNLIKLIKRNAFGFRNFENFKKRIFIALNIKKERTNFVLSRA